MKGTKTILKGQPVSGQISADRNFCNNINHQNFANKVPQPLGPSLPPQLYLGVTDANFTLMGLWMDAGVKGKRQVIDSYGFGWKAKEAVDKNECRETTRGIQGGESGAVQE